jgi:predicted membrane-bound spermidine synthase
VYLGVALTTLATLILELSLTRIFSVVFYYHFAFLAISIALFGLGAGGVFSYVAGAFRGPLFAKLGVLAGANGLLVVLALVFILSRRGEPTVFGLALVYFASAAPFFLAGTILALVISETVARIDRVYFVDLLGAAAGCLALIPMLNTFGGPNTVIVAGALFATSAAIWFNLAGKLHGRAIAVVLSLALVALLSYNLQRSSKGRPLIDVTYAKGQALEGERFVKWNSFSRIAVAPEKNSGMMMIIIDADASTGIANFDFSTLSERDRRDLLYQGPGFPYLLRPGAKTLVIGPGGGWDVARALASGSRDVTGVEINPIIADTIMRERFPDLSRRIFFRPEVRIVVEDGRSFIRRSSERYDVIQATLVDTWASTAAGAFALSENNLYTVEAFREYLSHLSDGGVLALTRWGFEPPRESLRLVSLAVEALKELGERAPAQHVMAVREGSVVGWGARDTVVFSRQPFTAADIAQARGDIAEARMTAVYLPGDVAGNPFAEMLASPDPRAYQQRYRFDVTPVTDNRPFFFYTVQPRDIWGFVTGASRASADFKINQAIPLLFGLVLVSLVATGIILALPPVVLGTRLPREPGVGRFLLYFACIGVGYILIQVALIQKFVLFLGHPTYALTVIIFSMLLASGFGSYWSRRLVRDAHTRLRMALGLIAVMVATLAAGAAPLATAGVGWPLWLKVAMTACLIAPAGFVMGIPFPTGLRFLESWHKPAVRWAWSLNAASSVLGSAAAVFLAIYIGLRETLLAGGLLYLGALWIASTSLRRAPREHVLEVSEAPVAS